MLLNVTEQQHKAIVNVINLAMNALGQNSISALLDVIGDALTPVSDEKLSELGYEKKAAE